MSNTLLYWDKLPFKFYAYQGVDYKDTITLYQDDNGTIPVDLTGCSFTGTLRYEYDLPVVKNITFTPVDLANGSFIQSVSADDLDDLNIESYNVSMILDVIITFTSGEKRKYYGYLIVYKG